MTKFRSHVYMVGTSLDAPGGMTAVASTYMNSDLAQQLDLTYLASYVKPGMRAQLVTMSIALWVLCGALIRGKVGLLHVHSASRGSFWRKSLLCWFAGMFDVPYVFHVHSGEFPLFFNQECSAWQQSWVRRTLRRAASVVVLTPGWLPKFRAIEPAAHYVVVGNPIEVPPQLPPLRAMPCRVLFLGRLREKKGVYDLLRAIPPVVAQHSQVKFVLAGDGEIDQVRAEAERLGIGAFVETPGWIAGVEKERALAEADVFVLPSYFEGLPICVLEAMAQGVPVIASKVGGIPDVVGDGQDALLIEAGDVAALSACLLRMLGDTALRNRLRDAAFMKASEHYATPRVLAKIETVYRAALADHAR